MKKPPMKPKAKMPKVKGKNPGKMMELNMGAMPVKKGKKK